MRRYQGVVVVAFVLLGLFLIGLGVSLMPDDGPTTTTTETTTTTQGGSTTTESSTTVTSQITTTTISPITTTTASIEERVARWARVNVPIARDDLGVRSSEAQEFYAEEDYEALRTPCQIINDMLDSVASVGLPTPVEELTHSYTSMIADYRSGAKLCLDGLESEDFGSMSFHFQAGDAHLADVLAIVSQHQ